MTIHSWVKCRMMKGARLRLCCTVRKVG
jgi:hypothetical protein